MGNHYGQQFSYTKEKSVWSLYCEAAIGAAGAPTINKSNSKGITSIARNAAGKYTITLADTFVKFLDLNASFVVASGIPAAPSYGIVSAGVGTAGAPTIVVQFLNPAGAATDPASGELLKLSIVCGNSSAY